MRKVLCGVAVLPVLANIAVASPRQAQAADHQPMQLSNDQMDKVTAGWALFEQDAANTSWTEVGVYRPVEPFCSCYLQIASPTGSINVESSFGPNNPLGFPGPD